MIKPGALPPPVTGVVRYESPELASLHEAGHAVAAHLVNAEVISMRLFDRPPPAHGFTRINRNADQGLTIALGGFAVERRLWEAQRLLLPDGSKPTEKEMLNRSADNADIDRTRYFGKDFRRPNGMWPRELDLAFMKRAKDLAYQPEFDFSLVERLAGVLLVEKKINASLIKSVLGPPRK